MAPNFHEQSVHHNAYIQLAAKLPYNMKKGWSITYLPGTDEYAVKILDGSVSDTTRLPKIRAVIPPSRPPNFT